MKNTGTSIWDISFSCKDNESSFHLYQHLLNITPQFDASTDILSLPLKSVQNGFTSAKKPQNNNIKNKHINEVLEHKESDISPLQIKLPYRHSRYPIL